MDKPSWFTVREKCSTAFRYIVNKFLTTIIWIYHLYCFTLYHNQKHIYYE